MMLSPAGARALKLREAPNGNPVLVGYADDNGTPTFGYGTTEGAVIGKTYTEDECDAAFDAASSWVASCIAVNVKVSLTQGQYDALFSFIYNVGSGAFISSTLLKKLNGGDYASVPAEMLRWTVSGGVKDAGLINRRNSEGGQWVQGAYVRGSKIDIEPPVPLWRSPKAKALATAAAGVTGTQITSAAVNAQTLSAVWHPAVYIFGALTFFGIVLALFKKAE